MRSTSIPSSNPSPKDAGLVPEAADVVASGDHEARTVLRTAGQPPRIEPRFDAPHSAKPTYEELRQLVAQYDRPVPRRRPMARTGIIALIFVAGTALGVGAASLLIGQHGSVPPISFAGMRALPIHENGISNGELPYDGRAAAVDRQQAQEAPRGLSPGELPYGGEASSGASADRIEQAASAPVPLPADASSGPAPQVAAKAEAAPPPVEPAEKSVKHHVPSAGRKAVSSQDRRQHASRRTDKDKEIQRIRQQAEEELKKKPDSGRRAAESHHLKRANAQKEKRSEGRARGSNASSMTAMLQQCELAGNIISREYCKWQLCSGKWGKNGCPSYPPHGNLY